jgi:hypothetical protein
MAPNKPLTKNAALQWEGEWGTSSTACTNRIFELLLETFPAHPTFALDAADLNRIMQNCVRVCIRMAGSEEKCLEIFLAVLTDWDFETVRKYLEGTEKLCGAVRHAFPRWLEKCDKRAAELEQMHQQLRQRKELKVAVSNIRLLDQFESWLISKQRVDPLLVLRGVDGQNACLRRADHLDNYYVSSGMGVQ